MNNFNFERANIKTEKRNKRIKQNRILFNDKNNNKQLINPLIQESEKQLMILFWDNKTIKYENKNWDDFIKN